MALPDVNPKQTVTATTWRKLLYLLSGKTGDHQQQVALTGYSDPSTPALVVRNRSSGGAFQVQSTTGSPIINASDAQVFLANVMLQKQAAPTVLAGSVGLYAKTDDLLYYKTSGGVETLINGATYGRNYLVNPGFEIWNRGNGPFATTGDWTADKWQLTEGAAATTTIARSAASDPGSEFCAAWTQSATGAASALIQTLEKPEKFRGKTVTFTMRAKTAYANAVRLVVSDGVTNGISSTHTGGNTYETLSCSVAVSAAATTVAVQAQLLIQGQAHSGELDNAVLAIGSSAPPFEPLTTEEEQERCRRFRQVVEITDTGRAYDGANTVLSATRACAPPLSAQTAPTLTVGLDVLTLAGASAGFTHVATTAANTSDGYGYHTLKTSWTKAANTENARISGTIVAEVRA